MTLKELKAVGVSVFEFGSPELDALHEVAKDPPVLVGARADGWMFYGDHWQARRTYYVYGQVYGWSHHGYRYIVDHGGFHTLQTILRGQVVPTSEEVT